MTAVCLIDTSIFVEILNVPVKAQQHIETLHQLEQRILAGESLFLPMATILETGNHIGQNGDGRARRQCAEHFVGQVQAALKGRSPFKAISFLQEDEMSAWLLEFPEHAMRGSGLGDLSIIHDWRRLCSLNPSRRVYIWSEDVHLSAFDQPPRL
ncbi:hypothetical protein ALQ08_03931 [Pseudomonas syringae pv. delphinii]|uniref:PIN domain-containing protein n=1 Tax=Pseudomonas syringae pv. delphinii TaxID=192088 RepID=A0A3M4BHW9_9PSED|nr:hypothetical protein [Pseudomonas syringae group genomosp. 3]RMP18762.1 hypothetical protein ALQ28_04532 [Pseudomonas syringae pv. delphinii]RMP24852.1 hypothetical protein ALQ27_04112 [Pseudomonas syringae pv. delphinii]RMQ29621.1 hypothetical protein ALQ08_03931 [Pseudomonas syringae pv. delphinii]